MNVLVTGGTGTLGRRVVLQLRDAGHRARILSRNPKGHADTVHGDLATGEGLLPAVSGMDAIIHAASATTELWKGHATDVAGTRRLLTLARDAGVRHVVFVSIVGMEGVAQPYYPREVASRLVEVVQHDPAGTLPDFGGPEVRDLRSLARSWLKARKSRQRLVNLWLPLKVSRQFAAGRLLCPEHKDGTITFEQYLAERYG